MRTLGRLIRRRYLTASVFLAGFAVVSAAGALLPKSIRTVEEGVAFLRTMLNAKHESGLNNLESLFAGLEVGKK